MKERKGDSGRENNGTSLRESERASSTVSLGRSFSGVKMWETEKIGDRKYYEKPLKVLVCLFVYKKLTFDKLWEPLNHFEQNGTKCFFRKINLILIID